MYNLTGRTTLRSLASIFKVGACLITNDSGPMHIAVAAGIPVVALFGPSNPVRTGPFGFQDAGARRRVLNAPVTCAPCYRGLCTHQDCLKGITAHQVVKSLEDLLGFQHRGVPRQGEISAYAKMGASRS